LAVSDRITQSDAITERIAERITYWNAFAYSDANSNGNSDTNTDTHSNTVANCNADTSAYRYTDTESYPDADATFVCERRQACGYGVYLQLAYECEV